MTALVITIQNGNQLPAKWSGLRAFDGLHTLAAAQKKADEWDADTAYWLEPSKTLFALAAQEDVIDAQET